MKKFLAALTAVLALASCNTIDSDRIPSYSVAINLSPLATWHTYGVAAFGEYRYFIRGSQPSGFPWTERTYTGFGGVLLICGIDPFTNDAGVPIAYDMSCPVECRADIRVAMSNEPDSPFPLAVCPVCKSRFDVIEGGGRPVSGRALDDHYGLRIYQCITPGNGTGGYLITN